MFFINDNILLTIKVYPFEITMSNKIRDNPIKVKLSLNSLVKIVPKNLNGLVLVKIVPKNVRPQMVLLHKERG